MEEEIRLQKQQRHSRLHRLGYYGRNDVLGNPKERDFSCSSASLLFFMIILNYSLEACRNVPLLAIDFRAIDLIRQIVELFNGNI